MNEAVDFEDFDDPGNDNLFDCEYSNIDEVINKIVTYTGVRTNVNTDNGDRTLIAYDDGEKRSAFFTESKKLTKIVEDPNRKFPFRATIKVVRYGELTGFNFFSPKSEITIQDKDNFDFYRKNKWRKRQ